MIVARHIVILCSRLDPPGGIERAVVNTASLFTEKGHRVTLIILDEVKEIFYPLHPDVAIIQQPLSFGITPEGNLITRKIKLLTDVLKLRKLLKQNLPDFIIATEYPFAAAAILAGGGRRSNIVSWEHHHLHELKRNLFWNRVFKLTYPRLDAVICLNEDEKKLFDPVNHNTVVIPNFISLAHRSPLTDKCILTIGRLTDVKGTDLLLKTAQKVLEEHPGWQWKLIGDGDMKEEAEQFIARENLQKRLILQAPLHHDIIREYQQASMYVMTSRNECFPMTLLEAQSAGLPCIAFDCDTGPRHIIQQNVNGLLIVKENTEKMADAISALITNEEQRKKMGEKAFETVQRFTPEKIYPLWEQLL